MADIKDTKAEEKVSKSNLVTPIAKAKELTAKLAKHLVNESTGIEVRKEVANHISEAIKTMVTKEEKTEFFQHLREKAERLRHFAEAVNSEVVFHTSSQL